MDFKNITDAELANFMVDVICRVELLKTQIKEHLDYKNRTKEISIIIKNSYNQLKSEFQKYYHYLSFKNESGSALYESCFYYSIQAAHVKGFNSVKNSKVNIKMLHSISDALDALTYIQSLEEWIEIANKGD